MKALKCILFMKINISIKNICRNINFISFIYFFLVFDIEYQIIVLNQNFIKIFSINSEEKKYIYILNFTI